MTPGIATTPAQPDILSVLTLFVAIVLFGLFVVGGLWVLAKLSEKMGWSKRRRRRLHGPRGARTRAPSKAVSFARQTERLDQLQVAPRPLSMVGDPQIHDMLQSWAVARGAPDLRVIAQVDLAALFAVTSTGDAGRAAAEVLRGHKVDYVLAEPGGMPVAGLMQTDAEDIHTKTLLRETVLRELFRKGALPLVELAPEATAAEVHRSLDAAFDLLPESEQGEQSSPSVSPMPQAVPEAMPPQIAEPPGFAPMQRPAGGRVEAPLPPMPRPGRRRRGQR